MSEILTDWLRQWLTVAVEMDFGIKKVVLM